MTRTDVIEKLERSLYEITSFYRQKAVVATIAYLRTITDEQFDVSQQQIEQEWTRQNRRF
jgi:hypothetical protein